jgi:long-subunit fatty acid transport protein
VIAIYRHQLANFRSSIDGSQGAFLREGSARTRTSALESNLELGVTNIGFSSAYRVNDSLWLGAGVSFYSMDLEAISQRFATTDVDAAGNPITFFEEVEIDPAKQTDRRVEIGEDSDIGFNLGIRSQNPSNTLSFGAVYRRSPKFTYPSEFRLGPKSIADGADPSVQGLLSGEASFHVPDVLGAGVSFRPRPEWTINFDYARVLYSNLEPDANFNLAVASGQASLDDFRVEDGNEWHLGAEYVWSVTGSARIAFRGGAWYDPDHQLTFVGVSDTLQARFPPGEDNWHVTGGIGILVSSFDLAFGFDRSEIMNRATFASAVRF